MKSRTLALLAVIIPLLALFIYVGLRSGPLAPVAVTVTTVSSQEITPALFGIGSVEARYTYKIGPIATGRIKQLDVQVGDHVTAGQTLGEMDPVDLDDRARSLESAARRTEALLRETEARYSYAKSQSIRYEKLFASQQTSEESLSARQQELQIAKAAMSAAQAEITRIRADIEGLAKQRKSLRLIAPSIGVVTAREAEPGTTLVGGQAAVEIIDPASVWINVRFDQINAMGLTNKLPAQIVLRSRNGQSMPGNVFRIEPIADAVTEEMLAKVAFDIIPDPLPPLGELAEVTVTLPALPPMATIPNAAVRRLGNTIGVWKITDNDLHFSPIKAGASDLNGAIQVSEGVSIGDQIVVYSEKILTEKSRFTIVDQIPGGQH